LSSPDVKVAFVHDWLDSYRGGERVLEALLELYPNAPIYTMFYDRHDLPQTITSRKIIVPALINKFQKSRKLLLPILPRVVESFDLSSYDLIISSSSCVAKGCLPRIGAKHLSYIHSPMRYIWDQRSHYFGKIDKTPILKQAADIMINRLRKWDQTSNDRVNEFVANSHFVADRIKRHYNRSAKVIFPPVNVEDCSQKLVAESDRSFYVAAGAFVPYKRFDLAIKAFMGRKEKLIVMGSGPLEASLKSLAAEASNIEFLVAPPREQFIATLQHAKALVFPCIEDFGITSIEALASGTPVIACDQGGALDYVTEGKTGLFCKPDDLTSLSQAIDKFAKIEFDRRYLQDYARAFSKPNFLVKIRQVIEDMLRS
jgi:glycosyltransferase involved in cell wall biosynthesis